MRKGRELKPHRLGGAAHSSGSFGATERQEQHADCAHATDGARTGAPGKSGTGSEQSRQELPVQLTSCSPPPRRTGRGPKIIKSLATVWFSLCSDQRCPRSALVTFGESPTPKIPIFAPRFISVARSGMVRVSTRGMSFNEVPAAVTQGVDRSIGGARCSASDDTMVCRFEMPLTCLGSWAAGQTAPDTQHLRPAG